MPNLYDLNHVAQARRKLERGEPCSHPGCLSHVSHPCEGCGRVGGTITLEEALAIEVENKRLADENARLREKAEVGEAVEAMPVGFGLSHAAEDIWLTWDNRDLDDEVDETCGQTALATLRELAALRAAKGEETDHAH